MVQLVIFDMDGLMLDTEQLTFTLWPQVFDTCPREEAEADCRSVIGRNHRDMVDILSKRRPEIDVVDYLARLNDVLNVYIEKHGVAVKQGLPELLDELERLGIPKVVATSTGENRARRLLEGAGIWNRFDGRFYGSMVRHSKPHPELFLMAAEQMGVEPARCMVLEDSIAGVTASRRAGMVTVMVPDMIQPDEEVRSMLDHCCDSLLEVIPLVQRGRDRVPAEL